MLAFRLGWAHTSNMPNSTATAGQVRTWDSQSDDWQGQYRLLEDLGSGRWLAEHLAPAADLQDRMVVAAIDAEERGWSYPCLDDCARMWADRVADAGRQFEIRLVSRQAYAEMF